MANTSQLEVRAPPLPKVRLGYVPLSMLVSRLAQFSFNELESMLDTLASGGMSSEEKKQSIIEYALYTRKQFLKTLVLTAYATDAAAISNVIDLKAWLDGQYRLYDEAVDVLCEIRKVTGRAKVPNPDLATAIEVLSTGEPQLSILKRYVPPPKLSAAETLKILRNINAHLAIRLGLHETLPPHFRDYKIASGRATFTVPDEFEVDLSIGDDDMKSQLYVIDVRPMFEPATRPLPASIFGQLEHHGNLRLGEHGLPGIFDFLHDYFLTHKIMILFRQASEMLGGRWTGNLLSSQHKRTLAIQYWIHRLGEKSWVEVGVRRGVGESPSRLGVRWVCDAVEVKDVEVPLDVANLSAELLMKTVIAMHTTDILTTLRLKLARSALFAAAGVVTLKTHPTDSFESYLKIQLTPSRYCKVLIEPITGRFALQKPSERAAKLEYDMNTRPAHAHESLTRFKFLIMQEEVEHRARSMGWEILKTLNIRADELKRNFPSDSRYMLYMRRTGWDKSWILAFVQQDSGESWWATEIKEEPMQWSISASMQIPTKGGTNPTYRFLDNLEKMAAGFITLYVNGRFLEQQNTMHTFRPSKAVSGTHSSALRIPDLYIRFPSLIKDAPWSIGVLSLSFQGLTSDDGSCTVIVVGRTKEPMTQLSSTDVSGEDMDVAFHPQSGSYAIRFTVKVGMPVIAQLVEKLYRIQRLIRFISIIRSFKLNCMHVTLGSVCFRYSDTPELSAEIGFTGEGNEEMKLILPKGSPHIRIQQLLQNHLNNVGLETVIKALHATLPLLLALDKVEATIPPAAEDDLIIIARGIDWFRLDYRSKNYVLDARLKHRRSVLYWYICDPLATPGPPTTRAVCEAVKRIWGEEGPGWQGLKTGVAVELSAVQEVIKIIHETVSSAPPGVIPAAAQPQQQPPQQQQQQIQLQAPPPPMAAHTPQQIHTPQQQMHTPKQTHTPLQQMHTPKQAHTPLQQMHTPQSSQPPHQQLHHTPQPAHQQLHLTSQSAQQLQLTPQSAQQLQHTPQTPHQQLQQTPQPQQLQNTQTPTGPTSQLAHLQHMQHQRMQALGRGAGGINGNGTGPPAPLGR